MTHPACAVLLTGLLIGSTTAPAAAVTFYDPGLQSLPSAQGWLTQGVGPYTQSLSGGVYVLDTTANNGTSVGSALTRPALLDTRAGFELDFGLRIVSESHAADNQRAGFSLIVTGADPHKSLELGFWQDELFAYTAGFVPGSAASFATTAATAYSFVVANDQYRLLGNGVALLSGSLVDYTANAAPIYSTAGAVFFGDDTSRAQSLSQLGTVTLTPAVAAVPEPASVALLGIGLGVGLGLGALARRRRRRR